MKKLLSVILVLSFSLLALLSCGGPANGGDEIEGYYTSGGVGYFFTEDGVVVVKNGAAQSTSYTKSGTTYTVDGVELNEADLTKADFAAPTMGATEYFTYETNGNMVTITGLTTEGKAQEVLFAPKGVTNIATGAFEGSELEAFVIGKTDAPLNLSNGAFAGTEIDLYIVAEMAPGTDLTCGNQLLDNTDDIDIKVESGAYSTYKDHYTWGNFADHIEKY